MYVSVEACLGNGALLEEDYQGSCKASLTCGISRKGDLAPTVIYKMLFIGFACLLMVQKPESLNISIPIKIYIIAITV